MNPIGIMQGRLSAPVGRKIQSFPVTTWREEFVRAREASLDCIEWIYEAGTDSQNPLGTDEGLREILRFADASGVGVRSLCADYYMTERLIGSDGSIHRDMVAHLEWLTGRAGLLQARYIVLPFVDSSSLQTRDQIDALASMLKSLITAAERSNVELHLETDLQPGELLGVLQTINHPLVRANYDIGNSASLGHDPLDELTLLGQWLGSVHVKDRILGGHTVPLGTGSADFPTCFRLISSAGFDGAFILQAAREDGISEVELARRNRGFVENQLRAFGNHNKWTSASMEK